jgi:ThiF family
MVAQQPATRRSALAAVPILLHPEVPAESGHTYSVYCIGCGGTGGWLAPHLVRRVWQLTRKWRQLQAEHPDGRFNRTIKLIFVDPDVVERKNVEARQNFLLCDIGYAKARVLATRYTLAYEGLQIEARVEPFTPTWLQQHSYGTTILIDCTDNAQARIAINDALARNVGARWPSVWWLSAGNGRSSGQVLLGNTTSVERLAGALRGSVCGRLPSPALMEPGLLIPKADEDVASGANRSCEDLVLADEQSPTINPHMAVWLDYYLHGLLNGGLALCGTYLSLEVGSARSVETSAQTWGRQFAVDPAVFLDPPAEPEETGEAEIAGEEEGEAEEEQEAGEELYEGEV